MKLAELKEMSRDLQTHWAGNVASKTEYAELRSELIQELHRVDDLYPKTENSEAEFLELTLMFGRLERVTKGKYHD